MNNSHPDPRELTVQFSLNIGCNANCFMCDKRIRDKISRNSYKNLTHLLRFLDPATVRHIKLLGGEPLLDKKGLLLFLKICHLKGYTLLFPTNGSLLTADYFDDLLHAGLSELTVSLDSYNAQEHDTIRGLPGMFKSIVDNLKYIRKQYPDFRLILNFLILPQNIHSLDKTISFAENLGINVFNVLYPENFGKNFERIQLTPAINQHVESIRSAHHSSRMAIQWNPNSIKEACHCQPEKISIFENSEIDFCNHYPFKKKYKLNQPLKKILQEPEIKDYFEHNTLHCGKLPAMA